MTGYRLDVPGLPGSYRLTGKGGLDLPDGGGVAAAALPVVASIGADASSGPIQFTVPGTLADDDLVIIFVHKDDELNADTWTFPTGFTELANYETFSGADHQFTVCYKLITDAASEPATWDINHADSAEWFSGVAVVTRGAHDLTTPIDSTTRQGEGGVGGGAVTNAGSWVYSFNGYSLDASGAEHVSRASVEAEADGEDYWIIGRTIPASQAGQTSAQGEWWYEASSGTAESRTVQSASLAGTSGGGYCVVVNPPA